MPRFFQPNEVKAKSGVDPDVLRDRRRRGLLEGIGVIQLPNGGWTKDPEEARKLGIERVSWVYTVGDLLALVVAERLTAGLGIDLVKALDLATQINTVVYDWAIQAAGADKHRYVLAWPSTEGENPSGVTVDRLSVIRLNDLNRSENYMAEKAILLDLKRLADRLPEPLLTLIRND